MLNKEEFDKNFEAVFGKKKQATIQEVDNGVYVVEIHDNKKDDDFDMDGRC